MRIRGETCQGEGAAGQGLPGGNVPGMAHLASEDQRGGQRGWDRGSAKDKKQESGSGRKWGAGGATWWEPF